MQWAKAALIGLLGSLLMFVVIMMGINAGVAPFNTPPSGAFLASLGVKAPPVALIGHFLYGAFWSVVLVAIYKNATSLGKGIGLALCLWLFMMLVYSPVIGWGVFGFGGAGHALPVDHPLHLGAPIKYVVATLVIHLIYGATIGWLDARWVHFEHTTPAARTAAS